jgi:2-polyprenyl-3-methyl-5-hydroxy-6-metoxy-1,4-benzoquinol methylase
MRLLKIALCVLTALVGIVPVLVGCIFGTAAALVFITFLASIVFALYAYASTSVLSDSTLAKDIASLRTAFGAGYMKALAKEFDTKQVCEYYTQTTDRDYRLLEAFGGPGLHTQLHASHPIGFQGGGTRQPAFVLAELRSVNATRVLEIGCGRGHCTLWLAGAAPDVSFTGIDLVPRHICVARDAGSKGGHSNVSFHVRDVTDLCSETTELGKFDLIFGCEALCHMDTTKNATAFIRSASTMLRPGGRLVIIDGFRSDTFNTFSPDQQTAMLLAESGFRICAMPSKVLWRQLAMESGFRGPPVRDMDLTKEALPFWTRGWRVARVVLLFPSLVHAFMTCSTSRRETAASLLSVATTAHAMHSRSAEYGMLVFEKI